MMHTVNDAVHKARNAVSIELWATIFLYFTKQRSIEFSGSGLIQSTFSTAGHVHFLSIFCRLNIRKLLQVTFGRASILC